MVTCTIDNMSINVTFANGNIFLGFSNIFKMLLILIYVVVNLVCHFSPQANGEAMLEEGAILKM